MTSERAVPFLLLDSGNALFRKASRKITESQQMITAKGIASIYEKMGYQAVNIGPLDCVAGLAFLKNLEKVNWVSASFYLPSDKPLFRQYIIEKNESATIAIIGLTPKPVLIEENIQYKNWQEILPLLLDDLKGKADFTILLSALPLQENQEIARKYPEIRVICSSSTRISHTIAKDSAIKQVNNTLIAQTVNRGKFLGYISISNPKARLWQNDIKDSILNSDNNVEDKENAGETDNQSQQLSTSTYTAEHIALSTNIKEHDEIEEIIRDIHSKINTFNTKQREKHLQERLTKHFSKNLVGSASCKECHSKHFDFWQLTAHARAFETLQHKNQANNTECIACHRTLEPKKQKILPKNKTFLLNLTDNLKNVGCESCHGAGGSHVTDPSKYKMVRAVLESTCRTCHTEERDDSFDYLPKKAIVACPKS